MKGLVLALQFLTRLPLPRVVASESDFAASMRWFPAAGLVVGLIVAAGAWAGARLDPWIGALAGLILWVAVTGALHLDGLGDVADAAGAAHKDRNRVLAVLADPHVGSFGAVAIALQLLAKLVLLRVALDVLPAGALAAIPFVARIGPLAWTRWLPPLHQGLGARFRGAVRPADLILWSLALLGAAWILPALLATVPLVALWGAWLRHRLGGISGDGHGAGVELVETGLLLALIAWARLA